MDNHRRHVSRSARPCRDGNCHVKGKAIATANYGLAHSFTAAQLFVVLSFWVCVYFIGVVNIGGVWLVPDKMPLLFVVFVYGSLHIKKLVNHFRALLLSPFNIHLRALGLAEV